MFRVVAGLGNPGREYQYTRHNAGFLLLEAAYGTWARSTAVPWKSHGDSGIAKAKVADDELYLVRPMSFMNRSGEPLASVLSYYKIETAEIIVAHDDVDLPLGECRIKFGGGDGGHNGLGSIISALGTGDFVRVRLGIGRPVAQVDLASWVLGKFDESEVPLLQELLSKGIHAVELLCSVGLTQAQNEINRTAEKKEEDLIH